MDDTDSVRMLPCKRARQIKKMAAFDLYQHFPCHIISSILARVNLRVVRTI
jgi:hypothetical protein